MSETRLPLLISRSLLTAFLLLVATIAQAFAQTTSFTYQGRLTDGGAAANGNYDLQFTLWDSLSGGSQVGPTQTLSTVSIVNGVFTVQLDFGAGSFPGANRFLEVSTRASGAGSFTLLTPRQPVTSTPYAVRSVNASSADALSNSCAGCVQDSQINSVAGSKIAGAVASATNATNATTATNATQLGGVAASQYVQTGDTRLSDARPPTTGSANYIQNTSGTQTASFNINGNGTVGGTFSGNVVNAATQFNLGGNRVFSVSGSGNSLNTNTIAGVSAGALLTPNGSGGAENSFFGFEAGKANTTGTDNSFFGNDAGKANTTGQNNSFFGDGAGLVNTQGNGNSFFGVVSGELNTTGRHNVFIGEAAGSFNTTGSFNIIIGGENDAFNPTGGNNKTGNQNTIIGSVAELGSNNLTNATAIGANAFVTQSNSLVLGSINNVNLATADTSVGIGTTAPKAKLHVVGNVRVDGDITLSSLGAATSTQATLCRNTSSQIAFCNSSSLRYKKDISTFLGGMAIVSRLRPISFTWKQDGVKDIGFGAEEVDRVAPMFTFRNDKGQIEGVRYDRLGVIFVNAFKEQQTEIKGQQQQLKQQQQEIEQLQAEIRDLRAASHRRGHRR